MPDLAEVRGQVEARRALEIALAGGHGLLLTGPPGIGKTLLARTIPGLLPPLDDGAALAVTIVASAAGEGPIRALRREPPFRAPHHTLSYAAMVGGGPNLAPGEITRAHHGVLFLDELAEFDRDVLEALRQPLEEGRVADRPRRPGHDVPRPVPARRGDEPLPLRVRGLRAGGPLPLHASTRSTATPGAISGPLRDRIDLWVSMPRVPAATLVGATDPEDSATVAQRIAAARAQAELDRGRSNGRLRGRQLRRACRLSDAAPRRVAELAESELASGRGTERLMRVARTIADLAGSPAVEVGHLDEAAWFDRQSSAPPGRWRPDGAGRRVAGPRRRRRPTWTRTARSARRGPCSPRSMVSARSASLPLLAHHGSALGVLAVAAASGGVERLTDTPVGT